jgi:putative transposase
LYQLRRDETGTRGVANEKRDEAYGGAGCESAATQVEVGVANGKTLAQACKGAEIVEQTYYRWGKEYGGLKVDQARRLKELEQENAKLKRLVSELSLEKLVLKDIASGNF